MYSPSAESSNPPVLHPTSESFGCTTLLRASAKGVLSATSTAMADLHLRACGNVDEVGNIDVLLFAKVVLILDVVNKLDLTKAGAG